MKKIGEHLGQIIAALAGVVLLITVITLYKAPIGDFFNSIISKETDVGNKVLDIDWGHHIIEGGYQTHNQGQALRFRSTADFSKFVEVKVDDTTVDPANYTATEGSTIITFTPEYSATLANGEHTIEVVSNDGSATAPFTIKGGSSGGLEPDNEEPVRLRIGNLHTNSSLSVYSLNNWDAYSHTNTWEAVTFNNTPSDFGGEYVWTDGEDIYYSYETNYVLNGKNWEEVDLATTALNHSDFWTDGENIYYSCNSDQYVFDTSSKEWTPTRWNGLRSFYGSYIWTDGENIYYSYNRNQYVLNGDTWEATTFTGALTSFMGHRIWSDGNYIYYSYNSNQYVLNGDTWEAVTWNGALTSFSGEYIWTDGTNVYYDTSYVLNGNTWQATTFTGIPDGFSETYLWSQRLWSDGYNIYRYYNGEHYVLK